MTLPKFDKVISVSPFAVPIPKTAKIDKSKVKRAVIYGDRHGIMQDEKAVNVLYSIIKDVEPHLIVNIGDDVDCYTISRFDKNPARVHDLQAEIDNTRRHLHQIAQLASSADRIWLEGNHEERLRKLVWRLPGAAQELAKLRVIQENLTWEKLVGTKEIGWTFVPSAEQSRKVIIPRVIIKHGTKLGNWSGLSAKAEMGKYGKSGLSGHSHRLAAIYHKDLNGSHVWCETGCLCTVEPEYDIDPDWQQGLVVVEFTNDWFNVELVYIENGKAQYRGVKYKP